MAIAKGTGGGAAPKIAKPPTPKITKNPFANVKSQASVSKVAGVTGKASVTPVYGGVPAAVVKPLWAQGIYGGIPPEAVGTGPLWSRGIYGGIPPDKVMRNTLGKNVPYYAPHEPIGPTYYPPYQPGAPDINKDLNLGIGNYGGGGGYGSGGGYGYGDDGGGGGGGRVTSPFGFTMGLINWRI